MKDKLNEIEARVSEDGDSFWSISNEYCRLLQDKWSYKSACFGAECFEDGFEEGAKDIPALIKAIRILSEGLEFYADKAEYDYDFCVEGGPHVNIVDDEGETARQALANAQKIAKGEAND